ncbi:unnamed protein product [Rhizophagus irregularis]|nr:unnamed protein product [Rhizophagus irregularis]CAB5369375.1 unnamed protein product [Rhizophagus irregularis]
MEQPSITYSVTQSVDYLGQTHNQVGPKTLKWYICGKNIDLDMHLDMFIWCHHIGLSRRLVVQYQDHSSVCDKTTFGLKNLKSIQLTAPDLV